jgi:hypothetical protein
MSKLETEGIENFNLADIDKNLFYNVSIYFFTQVIVKDLYRHGDFRTADSLIKESQIKFDQKYFRNIFNDLNIITKDLKEKNIDSLIEWCIRYKDSLDKMNSSLHFDALVLKYMLIFKTGSNSECVEFCKRYFQSFMGEKKYLDRVSRVMTLLMFHNNMENCPYTEFEEDVLWEKIRKDFMNDCCTILSISKFNS